MLRRPSGTARPMTALRMAPSFRHHGRALPPGNKAWAADRPSGTGPGRSLPGLSVRVWSAFLRTRRWGGRLSAKRGHPLFGPAESLGEPASRRLCRSSVRHRAVLASLTSASSTSYEARPPSASKRLRIASETGGG